MIFVSKVLSHLQLLVDLGHIVVELRLQGVDAQFPLSFVGIGDIIVVFQEFFQISCGHLLWWALWVVLCSNQGLGVGVEVLSDLISCLSFEFLAVDF